MNKIVTILLLSFFSSLVFAAGQHIIPADKAKIQRFVGESVFVECKNLSPFSTNCQVDCGNGRHYRKAKGYCHYLTKGNFLLNISTRYRGRNFKHTAVVSITEKEENSRRVVSNQSDPNNSASTTKVSNEKKLSSKSSSLQSQVAKKSAIEKSGLPEIDANKNLNIIANQANIDENDKQNNADVIQNLAPSPGFSNNQNSFQTQFVQQ